MTNDPADQIFSKNLRSTCLVVTTGFGRTDEPSVSGFRFVPRTPTSSYSAPRKAGAAAEPKIEAGAAAEIEAKPAARDESTGGAAAGAATARGAAENCDVIPTERGCVPEGRLKWIGIEEADVTTADAAEADAEAAERAEADMAILFDKLPAGVEAEGIKGAVANTRRF